MWLLFLHKCLAPPLTYGQPKAYTKQESRLDTPMSHSSTKVSLCEELLSPAASSAAPTVVTKVLHPTVGRADLSAVPCAMRCARLVFPHPAAVTCLKMLMPSSGRLQAPVSGLPW